MNSPTLDRVTPRVHRVLCWRGWPIVRWRWSGSQVRPNYWLDVLVWWFAPLHWSQCCAEKEYQGGLVVAYCMRRKGHPGKHTTNNGERFCA